MHIINVLSKTLKNMKKLIGLSQVCQLITWMGRTQDL